MSHQPPFDAENCPLCSQTPEERAEREKTDDYIFNKRYLDERVISWETFEKMCGCREGRRCDHPDRMVGLSHPPVGTCIAPDDCPRWKLLPETFSERVAEQPE